MKVVIDTASKIAESPEIIAEGINLAYKHVSDNRVLGWTRAYTGEKEKLELTLVGELNNLEKIIENIKGTVHINTQEGKYHIEYKDDPRNTYKRFLNSLKLLEKGAKQTKDLDSCLLADYLVKEEGAAIHFNDTAQARTSQLAITKNKDAGIGLLSSILKIKENPSIQEPLLVADSGMQIETSKREMILNAQYAIASARVMGMEPTIVFGSASNLSDHTIKSYASAYQALKKIENELKVTIKGFDKTYHSLTSETNIHLDSGRMGNEFANNVNEGTKLMKEMIKEMVKKNIKNGTIFQKIKMSALGILLNLSKTESVNYKKELELDLRTTHGHLLGTNSFKVHSNINPVIVASAILGAYDFGHVETEYFKHVEEMNPLIKKAISTLF